MHIRARRRQLKPASVGRFWRTEITPSVAQSDMDVRFFGESMAFIGLAWLISTMIICHVIFGTFLTSSFMFMGPKDAL
jgi:hypothetical protein